MSQSRIEIREVIGEKELKEFVGLPYSIYEGDKYWVAPMIADEMSALRAETNPAFEFCDVKLWIAEKRGKVVGRIGTIINKEWQKKTGKKYGRITRFDSIDDQEVADILLSTAEKYLKSKGMEYVHGPLGFSNLDHQGVLVEGFEYMPSIGSEYSKEYYHKLIENCGYEKEVDWVEYRITFPEKMPEKSLRVAEEIKERFGLRVREIKGKEELKELAPKIFALFNEAFVNLFGTYKLNEKMTAYYISKYMPVLETRYIKTVETIEGKLAGFIIAMPSLSSAMKKARGKLWPTGWWHIMRALKKPREIDLLLTGVKPELQRLGVAAILQNELWETAERDGVRHVETTGMLEENKVAIQMWKSYENIQHKRKRCYKKRL